MKRIIILLLILMLAGCGPAQQTGTVSKISPFLGGNKGLVIEFQKDAPPGEIFYSG